MSLRIWEVRPPVIRPLAFHCLSGCETLAQLLRCPQCGNVPGFRQPVPLVGGRTGDTGEIADVMWLTHDLDYEHHYEEFVVTERVISVLRSQRIQAFETRPVTAYSLTVEPCSPSRSGMAVRRLPYEGPELYHVWASKWVAADPGRLPPSASVCKLCGMFHRFALGALGVETWRPDSTGKAAALAQHERLVHVPRVSGRGVFISREDLAGADVFRLVQWPNPVFCTDRVRELLAAYGFTNVEFHEWGDVGPFAERGNIGR